MEATRRSSRSIRDEKLRHILERQRARTLAYLLAEQVTVRDEGRIEHDEVLDQADRVAADVDDDVELAALVLHDETLRRIDAALARLEAGSYGVCADCGDDIPSNRLRVLPFAERCRPCAARHENSHAIVPPPPSASRFSSQPLQVDDEGAM